MKYISNMFVDDLTLAEAVDLKDKLVQLPEDIRRMPEQDMFFLLRTPVSTSNY